MRPCAASTGPPKPMPTAWICRRLSPAFRTRFGTASWIWSRMWAASREGSTCRRSRAARSPRPWPIPSCSLVPPISIPSTQTSAMRSALSGANVGEFLGGEAAVQVVDDPVEDDQVQGFGDPHVVDRRVEIVVRQALELTTRESGDPYGRQPMLVGPADRLEYVGTIAGARDGQQQVSR